MQENVKAFDKATADKQRRAYIGSLIMIFVLAVCIILAIFAWLTGLQRNARTDGNISLYAADNLNVQYNTYAGTMLSNGTIEYDRTVDWNINAGNNPPEILTYPGERRYFMTVISSNETSQLTGTLYFENMLINTKFITTSVGSESVNFASQIDGDTTKQAFDLINDSTVVIGQTYSRIPLQPICENVTLPAATSNGGNLQATPIIIYWYVTLNGAKIHNDIIPTTIEEVDEEEVVVAHDAEFIQFTAIRFIPN